MRRRELQFALASSFRSDLKYASVNMTVHPLGPHGWLMGAYDQAILRSEQNKVVFNLKATERAVWSGGKCWLHTVAVEGTPVRTNSSGCIANK